MATTGTKTPPLEDDLTIVAAAPTTTTLTKKKKSKFGAADIMRAAMYMIGLGSSRRNNNKKGNGESSAKESTTTSTNSTLKLVGSVRPIYGSECVPENSPPHDNQVMMTKPHDENSEIQQVPPSSNGNEEGMLSAVSSAYWLVNEDGTPEMLYPPPANEDVEKVEMNRDDNDDTYYDGIQGDDSIDAKAEVFISQFYQQMRNQGLTPVDRG